MKTLCLLFSLTLTLAQASDTFSKCAEKFLGTYLSDGLLLFIATEHPKICKDCIMVSITEHYENNGNLLCARRIISKGPKDSMKAQDMKFYCGGNKLEVKAFYSYVGQERPHHQDDFDQGWGMVSKQIDTLELEIEGRGAVNARLQTLASADVAYHLPLSMAKIKGFSQDKLPPKAKRIRPNVLRFTGYEKKSYVKVAQGGEVLDPATWAKFKKTYCPDWQAPPD